MSIYKGIEVKDSVCPLLPHMPLIEEYREVLQSLQAVWDNLNLLGQLSGTTAEIGQTRAAFSSLTSDLLNNLAEQTILKLEQEMKAKSQVLIDILIRNLFERTADIGFLSTDQAIRNFCGNPDDPTALQLRFQEYVRKYSVYEDVALIANDGTVLARLMPNERVSKVHDQFLSEAQQTNATYVEAYEQSELFPRQSKKLIYAYRVTSSQNKVIGVLALCFRFEDEMARIFRSLNQAEEISVLALLDRTGQVIASSDRWQIPIGAEFIICNKQLQRIRFAGRNYLAYVSETHGYQGYLGPGWRGLAMIPIDQAFDCQHEAQLAHIEDSLLASVLYGGRAFPESLQAIPRQADTIQRNLNRSVWNGTVRQGGSSSTSNAAFSKILLSEISRIGMSMREVFARSIGNLQTTVISALLSDCQFLAAHAIDIMDRNLYERANDCRWWALDDNIAKLLADSQSQKQQIELEKALRYINGLYTVYSNLLVFDCSGKVIAVSNTHEAGLIGQVIDEPWVAQCLNLKDSQSYTVSAFHPSPLYNGQSTYIYSAALRHNNQVIGGIGIVFDSLPQFAAMLNDSLPRDTNDVPVTGSFAVFVDSQASIVASSDARHQIGEVLAIPADLLHPTAEGHTQLVVFEDQVMAVGAQCSTGYREYKDKDDSYRNDITALVFMPLGSYDSQTNQGLKSLHKISQRTAPNSGGNLVEMATFHVGEYWLGMPVSEVIEAIEIQSATKLANAPDHVYGAQIYQGKTLSLFNLHSALNLPTPSEANSEGQVIVLRNVQGDNFGILVDSLGEILEVARSDINDLSNIYSGVTPIVSSVVKASADIEEPMLVILSIQNMIKQFS